MESKLEQIATTLGRSLTRQLQLAVMDASANDAPEDVEAFSYPKLLFYPPGHPRPVSARIQDLESHVTQLEQAENRKTEL